VLVSKMGEVARQHYDWSKDVAAITAPTLLVFGDADAVRPAHAVEFFELLGGGQRDGGWDVLPGATHYNVFSSPALPGAVTSFLDADRQKAERSLESAVSRRY
jgi:pimeloyl-ACP methyl ester carboxylesterase